MLSQVKIYFKIDSKSTIYVGLDAYIFFSIVGLYELCYQVLEIILLFKKIIVQSDVMSVPLKEQCDADFGL